MSHIEHAGSTITVDSFRKGEGVGAPCVKLTTHDGARSATIRLPAAKLAELIEQLIQAKWRIEENRHA